MQEKDPKQLAASSRIGRFAWQAWRVAATGFAFVFLGLECLLLGLFVIPAIGFFSGRGTVRELRVQRAVCWAVRIYLFVIQALGTCTIRHEGGEKLRQPGTLVVANHPTFLDALALMSHMPQVDCVVKQSYFEHRILGPAVQGAGYIPSGDGPRMVELCVERLRAGRSIIIFPEGTRSPAGGLGPFARGAAHIALRAAKSPVPVTIRCKPPTLHRGVSWWQVPDRRFELSFAVAEPMQIQDQGQEGDNRSKAARELTESLRSYFERELIVV